VEVSNDEEIRDPGRCDHGPCDLHTCLYASTESSSERQESTAYTEYGGPQLIDQLAAAKKPAVGQPLVIGGNTVCGPKGNAAGGKMQQLNNNKNRTDEPADSDLIPMSWDDLSNLPADRVNDIQGAPVSVIGYLSIRVKEQTRAPGETTNCNLLKPDEVDWHIYLTQGPKQLIKVAIIVETTPRVRPNHKWTTQMLTAYVNQTKQVRLERLAHV